MIILIIIILLQFITIINLYTISSINFYQSKKDVLQDISLTLSPDGDESLLLRFTVAKNGIHSYSQINKINFKSFNVFGKIFYETEINPNRLTLSHELESDSLVGICLVPISHKFFFTQNHKRIEVKTDILDSRNNNVSFSFNFKIKRYGIFPELFFHLLLFL